MVELVRLAVAFVATVCFMIDIILRWRSRIGIQDIADWKGFMSFPALSVIGGVSSFVCGWLGWALMITAALAASDGIKISGGSGAIPLERAILIRTVLLSEVAVLAYCTVAILQRSETLASVIGSLL